MRKYILIFFFAAITSNLLLVDVWMLQETRTKKESAVDSQTVKEENNKTGRFPGNLNSKCDFACPQSCVSLVQEATSSIKVQSPEENQVPVTVITQIIAPTSADKPISEQIINFGGSVWTASDWQSVPDLVKTINPSNYGKIKNIYFEVIAHLSNENTIANIRLYNNSDKKTVNNSEVSFNSMKCLPAASKQINLESYGKEYQVQVKASENATIYIDSVRLRIVTQ